MTVAHGLLKELVKILYQQIVTLSVIDDAISVSDQENI